MSRVAIGLNSDEGKQQTSTPRHCFLTPRFVGGSTKTHTPSGEVLSPQGGTESPSPLSGPPVLVEYTVQDPLREAVQSSGRS